MIKNFALLFLAFFVTTAVFAQEPYPCGTGNHKSKWLDHYQKNKELFLTPDSDTLYLPVKIHVVGTDEGGGYYPLRSILESFCKLNADFEATNMQFYVSGELNYINNSTFYDHTFQQGAQMMIQNNVSNAINCYIVLSPAGNCGYYSPSRDGIALNKGCLGAFSSTWAHEIGHFLSLPHPFVGWEGEDDVDYNEPAPTFQNGRQVEKLDGSNCQNAADGFCDTAPDYLSFRWTCNFNDSSQVSQTDPNGDVFRSDGTLIMSYSNDGCSNRFSDEQIEAMRANVTFQRPNLIANEFIPQLITADVSADYIIAPGNEAIVPTFDQVDLEWDDITNASHYLVQVSVIPVFSTTLVETYVVEEPTLTLDNLEEDRTYWWRVKPYNNFESCVEFVDSSSFTTGFVSNVNPIESKTDFKVFPNPISEGNQWQVVLDLQQSENVNIRLYSVDGQLVLNEARLLGSGRQEFSISSKDLASGMYILEIQLPTNAGEKLYKKLNVMR